MGRREFEELEEREARARPRARGQDHPTLALASAVGNRAFAELAQRHAAQRALARRSTHDGEDEHEDHEEHAVETAIEALEWHERAEAAHELAEGAHGAEAAERALGASAGAQAAGSLLGAAKPAIFGPLALLGGGLNIALGAKHGGEKGLKQGLSGGAGVLGGFGTMLSSVLGAPASKFSAGTTAFSTGLALGEGGLDESPYDLPGTAANWGRSTKGAVRSAWPEWLPGGGLASGVAGGAGTFAGSVAMVPAATLYGAKRWAKKAGGAAAHAGSWLYDRFHTVEGEAAGVDMPVTEEVATPERTFAHEEAPQVDPWAVEQQELTPAERRRALHRLELWLRRTRGAH